MTKIDPAIQKVEFKFTALPDDEARVLAFLDGHTTKRRQVYFYDTQDLKLRDRDLVLRARVTDGEGESTAKLRPVDHAVAIAAHRKNDEVEIELDVTGENPPWSAKLDRKGVDVDAIAAGKRRSLFSDEQEELADKPSFDGVKALGPVEARVWKLKDLPGFPYDIAGEEWTVLDLHFVELSIKVDPGEYDVARALWRAFLTGLVKDIAGNPVRKTELVLERLAGASVGHAGVKAAT
jgi:hypothetical protein